MGQGARLACLLDVVAWMHACVRAGAALLALLAPPLIDWLVLTSKNFETSRGSKRMTSVKSGRFASCRQGGWVRRARAVSGRCICLACWRHVCAATSGTGSFVWTNCILAAPPALCATAYLRHHHDAAILGNVLHDTTDVLEVA